MKGWKIREEVKLDRPRYSPYETNYAYLKGFHFREWVRSRAQRVKKAA